MADASAADGGGFCVVGLFERLGCSDADAPTPGAAEYAVVTAPPQVTMSRSLSEAESEVDLEADSEAAPRPPDDAAERPPAEPDDLAADALAAALAANAALQLERDELCLERDKAVALLKRSKETIGAWERAASTVANALTLSPMRNAAYTRYARLVLTEAIGKLDFVEKLKWIDCSFPATAQNAPELFLESWKSLADSEWKVRWRPQWTCAVSVDAKSLVRCCLHLAISNVSVVGRLKVVMSDDLSEVQASFVHAPDVRLKAACAVTLAAQLQLSSSTLGEQIEAAFEARVKAEFEAHLERTMVAPKFLKITIAELKRPPNLSAKDLQAAQEAALQAAERVRQDVNEEEAFNLC
ncbi:hypothetical protein M885DRAFT_512507 [Pelagophyceae sp. CCMP2097]|nr:hypothetical protein M885DRAFT_512507 [Pelagophyceae sp. CCMP2097]